MPAPVPARPSSSGAGRGRGPGGPTLAVVVSLLVIAGGAAAVVRARRARQELGGEAGRVAAAGGGGDPGAAATVGGAGSHLGELPDLLRRARGNPGLLVEAYAAWARDARALAARRVLVGAMSALPLPAARLTTLLASVEASPMTPAADPITPDVINALSSLWQGDFTRRGRDLLFAGARPRVRDVVFDSFVSLALSDRGAALDGAQRGALTSDFIDLYGAAPEAQRPQILAVVRKLGSADTAELLAGHGLRGEGGIAAHARYQQELARAKAAAAAAAPAAAAPR